MAYSDQVIDHYENPRNVGKLDKNAKNVGTGMVGAPACGDVMRLQIQVDDNGIIEDARFNYNLQQITIYIKKKVIKL
jgi:nitrogen fixation NifU-like protein